ncbi:putative LRR receptor-like serine/threonine-protein kinase At1g74360 [Apium graveolens]|uniref:putative LRR receptor-like serine/threonine-protein kinase At1g74360 n=1 Tax=Apium graveolens TaxID=4045 RepID=UPI003D7B6D99
MPEERIARPSVTLVLFLIVFAGKYGDSVDTDKEVLLKFRSFLEEKNHFNRGLYTDWNPLDSSPCGWYGISCNNDRVTGINLSNNNIAGNLFGNFSALSKLTYLDLSGNTIEGSIPADLGRCQNLKFLNLSHNLIKGEFNLTGLNNLEILDLAVNRFSGDIKLTFPRVCNSLVVANISLNNLTGEIGNSFDECWNLEYVDLSSNFLTGNINLAFERLKELQVSNNSISGTISPWVFSENCSLEALDLSENLLYGEFPGEIAHCKNLVVLNLWGNSFTGLIPAELGSIMSLQALLLGNNKFNNKIPESLVGLKNLVFLELSKNNFGGDIQEVIGRMTQVKYLLLNENSYTGGLFSSGILNLSNIARLDLSYNNLSGNLPIAFTRMLSLKHLFLASNQFSGNIPLEYGNFPQLQTLDLSYNMLSGSIPPTLGNLNSLLWLMLANNKLTGEIPPELGNCSSLLWLNFENNQISGKIPPELANMGNNATPIFLMNRVDDRITAGSGECSVLKRWIPAEYAPFSFVFTLLTVKKCRGLWDMLLKGYGIFPVCAPGSNVRTNQITGYVLLLNNLLSGEIPPEIGKMRTLSMLQLGINNFDGTLPEEIAQIPLVVFNVTQNKISGEIPVALGRMNCLRNLDLSYNNFSGRFPASLNNLTDLTSFNISYNPYVTGLVPGTGQLATFDNSSFLGNPLLRLPPYIGNNTKESPVISAQPRKNIKFALVVFLAITLAFVACGIMSVLVCIVGRSSNNSPSYLLEDVKERHDTGSVSGGSSPWLSDKVTIIRLDKTEFTHKDIFVATGYFSDDRIIGRGGFGTVYRGVLPDGREVAVKKQQREGPEGEREFRAEMEVLTGNGFGWPHPNLVTLYGWCLDGSEKLLVYEYMVGGSLEELISDRTRLTWRRRIDIALDVARALVFLHHECFPLIVHRDVKASNVLLDKDGKARVTDFGLARVVDAGGSHVSTMVAGTVGYVAPEYGQTWQATTKGDVYSYGVLVMELATGRRAVDGGEECLVEWARRVMGNGRQGRTLVPVGLLVSSRRGEGAQELCELLRIGIRCAAEMPQARPNMKEVLAMLVKISSPTQKGFEV